MPLVLLSRGVAGKKGRHREREKPFTYIHVCNS
jgi:hypothetical protein